MQRKGKMKHEEGARKRKRREGRGEGEGGGKLGEQMVLLCFFFNALSSSSSAFA